MNSLIRILSLCALICVASCSKQDGTGGTNGVNGYKYLSTLNVTDAKSLYKQSETSPSAVSSRSVGDLVTSNTYWKVDANGETQQLVFTGEEGNTANISIESIYKLGSRMLYVIPSLIDLQAIGVYDACHCIIDKETGTIYSCPLNLNLSRAVPTEDANGDVFFTAEDVNEYYIFKLDIEDLTISEEVNLSTNLILWANCEYEAFGDGYLYIPSFNNNMNGNWYGAHIKTPSNSLIALDCPYEFDGVASQDMFIFKGELYEQISDVVVEPGIFIKYTNKLYRVKVDGDSLVREFVYESGTDVDGILYSKSLYNPYKDCMVFQKSTIVDGSFVGDSYICEFDGTNMSVVDGVLYDFMIGDDLNGWFSTFGGEQTSNSWWLTLDESYEEIYKTSMIDYSQTKINIGGSYYISQITSSTDSPDITFVGTPLDNITSTIIGTIGDDNQVTQTLSHSPDMEVIDLIPLN